MQFTRSRVKIWCNLFVGVAELADAADLKSADGNIVPVRSRSPAPRKAATIWWLLFFMQMIHREKRRPATDAKRPSARRAAIPVTGTKKHSTRHGCCAFYVLVRSNRPVRLRPQARLKANRRRRLLGRQARSPAPRKAATIWWLLFFMWTIHREKRLPATDTLARPSARRAAIPVTGTKKHGILCGCRAFVMLTDYNTFQTRQGWEQQPVPGTPCACF